MNIRNSIILILSILCCACAKPPKKVSILGDSYSTMAGWITPDSNAPFYPHGEVTQAEQTWWHQVISSGNYALERNNSYSGSTMTYNTLNDWRRPGKMDLSTTFIERAKDLGNPDIILICGGTNDEWNNDNSMGEYKYSNWTNDDLYLFRPGTAYLLNYLKTTYPDAQVIFVLNDILNRVGPSIETICAHYNIPVVKPYAIEKDESGHPTPAGMTTIAEAVKARLNGQSQVYIAPYRHNCRCAVSLTFDDGLQEHYTLIAPHLDSCGLHGSFCINGAFIGDRTNDYAPYMTWDECRHLAQSGHEISSHGWSHVNLYDAPMQIVREQIQRNDSAIETELGFRSKTFFFPFNGYGQESLGEAMKGRIACRTSQFALGQQNSGATWQSMTAWLQQQINNSTWGITMTHGIHTGWDQWNNPELLWDFFRLLAQKSDTVWTATFAEVAAYIAERDAVRLRVENKRKRWIIYPTLDLDSTLYNVPLTLVLRDKDGASRTVDIDPYNKKIIIEK